MKRCKCGDVMLAKFGRNGLFYSCASFPFCKESLEYKKTLREDEHSKWIARIRDVVES